MERENAFKEENVVEHNCDFRDFFSQQHLAFWLIFQPSLKCNYGPFLHLLHSTLFTAWVFFGFSVRSCKIWVRLSALFRKISPPLRHFATSNSRNILIFESSWRSILANFPLKVAEKFLWLLWLLFLGDIFFNVLKTNLIIGENQKWLENLERYLHFFFLQMAELFPRLYMTLKEL